MENTSRRRAWADPQDQEALVRDISERARIEGPGVYLEVLTTLEIWDKAPGIIQDEAIKEVLRRLGSDYTHQRTMVYSCADQAHRIGVVCHGVTGIEMSLVPGSRCNADRAHFMHMRTRGVCPMCVKPFLVGRWPVVGEEWPEEGLMPSLPVTAVPLMDVRGWCASNNMRLPRGDEWFHAASGGAKTKFPWGDKIDDDYCWHANNSGVEPCRSCNGSGEEDSYYAAVSGDMGPATMTCSRCHGNGMDPSGGNGHLRPSPTDPIIHERVGHWNAFGLVDAYGNIFELVSDCEADGFTALGGCYATHPETFHSSRGALRWYSSANSMFAEGIMSGGLAYSDLGFRVAKNIPGD